VSAREAGARKRARGPARGGTRVEPARARRSALARRVALTRAGCPRARGSRRAGRAARS
jgi:hypothetical protein